MNTKEDKNEKDLSSSIKQIENTLNSIDEKIEEQFKKRNKKEKEYNFRNNIKRK